MALSLGAKQELFAELLPHLIAKAVELGYHVRLRELYRDPIQAKYNAEHCCICEVERACHAATHSFKPIGLRDSLHCEGLAIDLVLFAEGVPLERSDDYAALGSWWESLHELCRWGGRFGDGGHFSITHRGRM